MLQAITEMVKGQIPYPTYFLKPGMVALTNLMSLPLLPDGQLPAADDQAFAVTLKG